SPKTRKSELCIWMAEFALQDFPRGAHSSMITPITLNNPDIDPSWYTGRGIRPVGRFGRRGTTWEEAQKSIFRSQGQTCVPITEFIEDN
uniref:Uncharacterized protein n=1 Tax=Leptobrachium leishanense TaxID=445787 RepID=A0A8C5N4F9_9ANUR